MVDYKSGGLDDDSMDTYRRQLLGYSKAIAAIWPSYRVYAGLVVGEGDWVAIDG